MTLKREDLVFELISDKSPIINKKLKEGKITLRSWRRYSPRAHWVKVTHKVTKQSVTAFDRTPAKARKKAMHCLEILVNSYNQKPDYPEIME